MPGIECFVETIKEHRLLLVFRGEGLSDELDDTDPQKTAAEPNEPKPRSPEAEKTADLVKEFLKQARKMLEDSEPANMVILRGFSKLPAWPGLGDLYGIRAAAVAEYPMYRGLAKLIGMRALETGKRMGYKIDNIERHWNEFDFFFIHIKHADSAGEDGDFDRKSSEIGEVDEWIPRLLELEPDVLVITGDHSTPSTLSSHSWHPVPVLLWSRNCRTDKVRQFGERDCMTGWLGPRIPAVDIMPLALAHAGRLKKYGA